MVFNRLNQQTTPEAAVEVLREAILSGALAQGSQLREVQIAAEMGISRGPLREALHKLEDEGLVDRISFRGSFVAQVSEDTINEITSLRVRLEPFAVERSLSRLIGADAGRLAEATEALERAVKTGDVVASLDTHLALHRLFYELADHRWLLRLWTEWESQLRLFLAADHSAFGHLDRIQQDHLRLDAVIRTGDMAAITADLTEHIENGPRHAHEDESYRQNSSQLSSLERSTRRPVPARQ